MGCQYDIWKQIIKPHIPLPLPSGYIKPPHFYCFHNQLLEFYFHYKYLHIFTIFHGLIAHGSQKYKMLDFVQLWKLLLFYFYFIVLYLLRDTILMQSFM